MSNATLEKTAVDTGSDLASLVIAFHREKHTGEPLDCQEMMCQTAFDVLTLDEMFYGTDV